MTMDKLKTKLGVLFAVMFVVSMGFSSSVSALWGYDYAGKVDMSDTCIWVETGCAVAGVAVLAGVITAPAATIVAWVCAPAGVVCVADAIIERYTNICGGDIKLQVYLKKWWNLWNPGPVVVLWPSC